jgi:hypothetical protein
MMVGDWAAAREEARLTIELLRELPSDDPTLPALVARAEELQRLGWLMREVDEATRGGLRH